MIRPKGDHPRLLVVVEAGAAPPDLGDLVSEGVPCWIQKAAVQNSGLRDPRLLLSVAFHRLLDDVIEVQSSEQRKIGRLVRQSLTDVGRPAASAGLQAQSAPRPRRTSSGWYRAAAIERVIAIVQCLNETVELRIGLVVVLLFVANAGILRLKDASIQPVVQDARGVPTPLTPAL